MNFDFFFMLKAFGAAVQRIPVTLYLATIPVAFGIVFGLIIALIRYYEIRIIAPILKWIVTFVKGIPVILLLLVFYVIVVNTYNDFMAFLGLPYLFKDLDPSFIVIAALTIPAVVGMSEAFRGALASIDRSQFDAAYSVGMTKVQTLLRIILLQMIPVCIPILGSLYIGMLKGAALASVVAGVDILNGAIKTARINYRYFEAYVAAAIIYWALAFIIERIFYYIEAKTKSQMRGKR
ncbi:L-cystine transport system permease protein TcyM [Spirochaetia bacterium]|nr:L-cystine transport system permease protein TcyM [Spirochaetia bacterium]